MSGRTVIVRPHALEAVKVILNCTSDEQLAKTLGCGRQSLYRYRDGHRSPSPEFIATVLYETSLPFEHVFSIGPKR